MVSLTDSQLKTVMDVAASVSPDRRGVFLERVGAMLRMRHRFTDLDVDDVAKLALCGLTLHYYGSSSSAEASKKPN